MEPDHDRVYTVTDYWDGPRKGIADFEGRPHLYVSDWDDPADDYASTFRLSPVEHRVLALALEDWDIWLRWQTAFHKGRTTLETHPALPEDRARHDELREILERNLKIDERDYVRAHGDFKPLEAESSGVGHGPLQVKWTRCSNGEHCGV